jgi:hypothetical protein
VRRRSSAGRARILALACAVVALLAGAVAAGPASAFDGGAVTHAFGDVSATLKWKPADDGISDPSLAITRAGTTYPITITDICEVGCVLVTDSGEFGSILKVTDLDGDGEPDVLVDTFSGGAHCCTTTRLLSWNGSGYTATDFTFQDVSYKLRNLDGDDRRELVSANPLFSAAFTAFAASGFPLMILQVSHGRFVDVTRKYPTLIRRDAASQLKTIRKYQRHDDIRGFLAAYCADEYLLGHGSVATAELDRQRQAGHVSAAFKPYLLKKLHAWGYR